jgi:hypothetical protein
MSETINVKNEFGIEQAAHDISKAKELEKLAQDVLVSDLRSIKISCKDSYQGAYLSSIENESDDVPREELAKFLENCAARHRASAQQWLTFALTNE